MHVITGWASPAGDEDELAARQDGPRLSWLLGAEVGGLGGVMGRQVEGKSPELLTTSPAYN